MSKTVNYTAEQVKTLVSAYKAANSQESRDSVVNSFANDLGKSVASIRAKLSREGVYVKKETATKKASSNIKKAAKVAQIAARCDAKDLDLWDSLEKTTHYVLDEILKKLSI